MALGPILRILWRLFQFTLVVVVLGFLHFYLPSKDVVRIVGTDVKRMDARSGEFISEGSAAPAVFTRDVRFINSVWPGGSPSVYRNEETGWGFPWYFKFDSANVQARAQNLVSTAANPTWTVVTHYGWRIEILSMFPNAVRVEAAPSKDYFPIPWFRIAIFLLLLVGCYVLWRAYRRFRWRYIDPLLEDVEGAAAEAGEAAEGVRRRASGWYGRLRDWLDTWRAPADRRNRE